MKRPFAGSLVIGVTLALLSGAAGAASIGTVYDMQRMLSEPHPLANHYGTRWQPAVPPPPVPVPASPVLSPAPRVDPGVGVKPIAGGPPAPRPAAGRAATGSRAQPRGKTGGEGLGGILSEIRIGALIHDQGPFSSNKEDGIDGNFELLFTSPGFLDVIWSPRPHLGVTVNSEGDTSQVYFGLSYEWEFWDAMFAGFSVGGAVHDGETTTEKLDRKELGCKLLFRESLEIGVRFAKRHSLSGFLEHSSNAKLCSTNEGLENAGLRYGYRF